MASSEERRVLKKTHWEGMVAVLKCSQVAFITQDYSIKIISYTTFTIWYCSYESQLANSNYALLSHFFWFESIHSRRHQCPSLSQWIPTALPLTWTRTFTLGQGYITPKQLLIHTSPWPRWKLRFCVLVWVPQPVNYITQSLKTAAYMAWGLQSWRMMEPEENF